MSRHHEFCIVDGCNRIPEGKVCSMHKSRFRKYQSYNLPIKDNFSNNPPSSDEIIKICKVHGNLERKNVYIRPKTGHKSCKICQRACRTPYDSGSDDLKTKRLEENINLRCSICKEFLSPSLFSAYWLKKKFLCCIVCSRISNRKSALKKYFNLSLEQYNVMLENQDGKCAICNKEENILHHSTKIPGSLCVDHDHKDGKTRGLLCSMCNFGIGYFKDSKQLLIKAIKYLDKYA